MIWSVIAPEYGDMIRVHIGDVCHYGVYVAPDEIIQFGAPPVGTLVGRDDSAVRVCRTDMQGFSVGGAVEVAVAEDGDGMKRLPPDRTVALARSRVGEGGYNAIYNNCEHFAYECVFGVSRSTQEEMIRSWWKNRRILNIYIAPVLQDCDDTLYPPQRNDYVASISHMSSRRRSYSVWKLLGYALRDTYGKDITSYDFSRNDDGSWQCDDFCFSLSHTRDMVAVALCDTPVGVDIEDCDRFTQGSSADRLPKIINKILSPDDAYPDSVDDVLALWTRKESIFKRTGGSVFVPSDIPADNGCVLSGVVPRGSGVFLSVCADDPDRARIYYCADGVRSNVTDLFVKYHR